MPELGTDALLIQILIIASITLTIALIAAILTIFSINSKLKTLLLLLNSRENTTLDFMSNARKSQEKTNVMMTRILEQEEKQTILLTQTKSD